MSGLNVAVPLPSPALRSFAGQWHRRAPDALSALREASMQRFLSLGLPTARDESWRHTNLRALSARSFTEAPPRERSAVEPPALLCLLGNPIGARSLVVINGRPLMPIEPIKDIQINTIKELSKVNPAIIGAYLALPADADLERFTLLNTALFVDGFHLRIDAPLRTPIIIQYLASGDGEDSSAHPRTIIQVAPGASATIIEHHLSQGPRAPLVNSHTHLKLERNARIEHYRIFSSTADAQHLDTLQTQLHEASALKQFTIALGGGLVRAALDAHLAAPGAELEQYSLLVGHAERHVDCATVVRHAATDTRSSQTARALAGDESRIVINSKVVVSPAAVRSQSTQSCRGLLLSAQAEIDTRPQLEIHADEVKCAHGATTGRLDPDMLFYLLSRGLDRNTAQSLLIYAFLADVLTGMSLAPTRSAIEAALVSQLPDSQTLRSFR